MNGATWFGLSAAVNVVSVMLYVLAVREHKRIERIRRRARLEERAPALFGNEPAGVTKAGPRW